MKYEPMRHHRRSIRLKEYDYSWPGDYFITICVQGRRCVFGEIVNDEMHLNDRGRMIEAVWKDLPNRFPVVELDEFVVMPNHLHGIICLRETSGMGDHKDRPYKPTTHQIDESRRGESCIRPKVTEGEHEVRPYENQDKKWPRGTEPDSIPRIMQAFKSLSTDEYIIGVKQNAWPAFYRNLWQRNYYEHIVRTEKELQKIRDYITYNPLNWPSDIDNPRRSARQTPKMDAIEKLIGRSRP